MKIIKVLQLLIPKIVKVTEETIIGEEGCLSFSITILKGKKILWFGSRMFRLNAKECTLELVGWNARILVLSMTHLRNKFYR